MSWRSSRSTTESPLEGYLRRQPLETPRLGSPPPADLEVVVVIPCREEPEPLATLESLRAGIPPGAGAEVIVVVNGAADDPPEAVAIHQRTLADLDRWIAARSEDHLRFHRLDCTRLPPREAGVGLARKLGMDAAAARFLAVGNDQGIILCLDADCRVAPNYLAAVVDHFRANPQSPGATVPFAHPLATLTPGPLRRGMIAYELYLRYHFRGLLWAGHPHAVLAMGSAMAVRAGVYAAQGGMNRRQGGEDFYFLQKIVPLGGFTQVAATLVEPAARLSARAPFGTGRALGRWLEAGGGDFLVYDCRLYAHLHAFFTRMEALPEEVWGTKAGPTRESPPRLLEAGGTPDGEEATDRPRPGGADAGAPPLQAPLEPLLEEFLRTQGFDQAMARIRRHTTSRAHGRQHFYRWFNGLLCLKYLHHGTARGFPKRPVVEMARTLLNWWEKETPTGKEQGSVAAETAEGGAAERLLERYRGLDRGWKGSGK
ncbi:MAG: glycosyltransferase [Magnetococcales bacterium]|nr:glycosyltransferase [Magnetococcales bacterium]